MCVVRDGSFKNGKIVPPELVYSLREGFIEYVTILVVEIVDGEDVTLSKGYSIPEWMGKEEDTIDGYITVTKSGQVIKGNDGFSVSSDQDPNTHGILFWDKPFVIHGEDGVDRCLLIMDTQGLWDYDTSNDYNTCVFGLSSFLASYLIFNNKGMLDTERLKSFSNLSMFSNGLVNHSKAFQHLDILLRDYSDYDTDVDGIQEAVDYSKEWLGTILDRITLKKEVNGIRSCFEQFDAFCLPRPGNIDEKQYKGSIGGIRHMFLRILGFYIDKVIKSIQPRRINGEELTMETFVKCESLQCFRGSYALECANLFRQQKTFPDSNSLIDAMYYAVNVKIVDDSVSVSLVDV